MRVLQTCETRPMYFPMADAGDWMLEGDALIRALLERTHAALGRAFLQSLVVELGRLLGADQVLITRRLHTSPARAHLLAASPPWDPDTYALAGEPCELVYEGRAITIQAHVGRDYPGEVARGFESYYGWPLCQEDGRCIGHLAILGRRPTLLTASQLEAIRLFAGRAEAELHRMELALAQEASREREATRTRILQSLTAGKPMKGILEDLIHALEAQHPGMLCSVLLLDDQRRHLLHGAAPSLPAAYNLAVNGIPIGRGIGSCGHAAATGERVIAADLATHPNWQRFKDLALSNGLASCWSEPIRDQAGRIIGTFAIYQQVPGEPTSAQLHLIEEAALLLGLVLENQRVHRELLRSRAWYEGLLRFAPDGVLVLDLEGRILETNAAQSSLLGVSVEELKSHPIYHWRTDQDRDATLLRLAGIGDTPLCFESSFRHADGHAIPVEIQARRTRILDREVVWGSVRDITLRKAVERELRSQAATDPLTGLPNRRAFLEGYETALARSRRHGHPLSLLMMDLDHFKAVNDTFGHAAGDCVLQEAGVLLQSLVRAEDLPARLGGEEFALLLPDTDMEGAMDLAIRLVDAFRHLICRSDGNQIRITCSVGVATLADEDEAPETLLRRADEALYRAKAAGRNQVG